MEEAVEVVEVVEESFDPRESLDERRKDPQNLQMKEGRINRICRWKREDSAGFANGRKKDPQELKMDKKAPFGAFL